MTISTLSAHALHHTWCAFLLRSLITLLFTLTLILWQPITISALLYLLVVYILIDSAITIATGLLYRRGDWMIFGIIACLIGSYGLFPPAAPAFFFLALITAWTLLRGIFELSAALKMHECSRSPIWLSLSASISILFSLFSIIASPEQAMSLHWPLLIYLASIGSIWMCLAFAMRKQDVMDALQLIPIPISIRKQL